MSSTSRAPRAIRATRARAPTSAVTPRVRLPRGAGVSAAEQSPVEQRSRRDRDRQSGRQHGGRGGRQRPPPPPPRADGAEAFGGLAQRAVMFGYELVEEGVEQVHT